MATTDAGVGRPSLSMRLQARMAALAPFAAVLGVWWALACFHVVAPIFLPPLGATLRSFYNLFAVSFLKQNLIPSVFRVAMAFFFSAAFALPLGVLAGTIPFIRNTILPLCSFSRYLPVAALVPLCILWFGIDDAQKVAVITIGCCFQLLVLIAADAASTPVELVETGRTFGLSRSAVIWRIILPWCMPAIWDDLRVCAGWAWSYLVLAELVAGNRGIGYFIIQAQRYLEIESVFAGILLVGLLGLVTDQIFRITGRRLFAWV